MFLVNYKLCLVAVMGVALVALVLEIPILAVALLLAARLMDTSANAFFHIGKISIGMFEPTLLLALCAWVARIVWKKEKIFLTWPWLPPVLALIVFQVLSLKWCVDPNEGISEIITMLVVLANAILIISFVRTPKQFLFIIYAWLATNILIGFLSMGAGALGIDTGANQWQAASGGARETGLGQQPNWYAMTMMFIVHTTFGLALIQKKAVWRWFLILAGFFVFLSGMTSGSRGGIYSVLVGGMLAALALPLFRKWFLRFLGAIGLIMAGTMAFSSGTVSRAFYRIYDNIDHTWSNVRGLNWSACYQMFLNSDGLGIGAGGYVDELSKYSWFLYESVYRYPHGIFWGVMAHYGVIGFIIFGWLFVRIFRMARDLTRMAKGTVYEIPAWTMPATMLGYFAWSFVEFEYNEKPFWEFLALYTALYFAVKEAIRTGQDLPLLPSSIRIPWRSNKPTAEPVALPIPPVPPLPDPEPAPGL